MKYFRANWLLVQFLAMAIVPAVAQFEIAPDHPGDGPLKNANAADSNPAGALRQQIAEQTLLLEDYRRQIQAQAALVEEARQLLISPEGSADEAGESIALSVSEKRLQALQGFLEDPIRVAEANLALLETRRAALMAPAKDRPPAVQNASGQARVLVAWSPSSSPDRAKQSRLSRQTSEPGTRDTESMKHTVALNH